MTLKNKHFTSMTECNKCRLPKCKTCKALSDGVIQCSAKSALCSGCGITHCLIHLVLSMQEGPTPTSYYCHACAEVLFPGEITKKRTKKNYSTQEKCGGCPSESTCPSCLASRNWKECSHTNGWYPTSKCHDCGHTFCDTHLCAGTADRELLIQYMRDDKEVVNRCHACSRKYEARPHQCHYCKSRYVLPLKVCTRCGTTPYCDRECQTRDWARHKHTCKLAK